MIVWSQQQRIISDLSLSFKLGKVTHTKISSETVTRDKIFLGENKFKTKSKADFTFVVLWTLLNSPANKITVMKKMQSYTPGDIKDLNKRKTELILYENYLHKPVFVNYLKLRNATSRIQKHNLKKYEMFFSFFPRIKEFLDNLDTPVIDKV